MTQPHNPFDAEPQSLDLPGYEPQFQQQIQPQLAESKSKLALSAFIVGLVSLISVVFIFPPVILGPIAVILAIAALVRNRAKLAANRRTWMSVAGLICAGISIAIFVGIVAFGVFIFNETGAINCLDLPSATEIEACLNTTFSSADASLGQN